MSSKTKLNVLALGANFIIFFFSMISMGLAWLASYTISAINQRSWFLSQPRWINLLIIGLGVFIAMTGVTFWVDSFLIDVYSYLESKLGRGLLGFLSVVTLVVLIIALYFTLPLFLVYTKNQFWL